MSTTLSLERSGNETQQDVLRFEVQASATNSSYLLEVILVHGDTLMTRKYVGEQIITDMGESNGSTAVTYRYARDEQGRAYHPEMGISSIDMATNFLGSLATREAPEYLTEQARIFVEFADSIDGLSQNPNANGVLVVAPSPDERAIEMMRRTDPTLNFELGMTAVQFAFEDSGDIVMFSGFAADSKLEEVVDVTNDLAEERGGRFLSCHTDNKSTGAMMVEFADTDGNISDIARSFMTKYDNVKNTQINRGSKKYERGVRGGVLVNEIINSSEPAIRLAYGYRDFMFDLASEVTQERASISTRLKAKAMLEARRDDGTSFVPQDHIAWFEALVSNANVELTKEMASIIGDLEEYMVWHEIKNIVQSSQVDDSYTFDVGGVDYSGAALAVNSDRKGGCPTSNSANLANSNADLSNMSIEERRRYHAAQRRLEAQSNKYDNYGVCIASGRSGCESYVSVQKKMRYENVMREIGEFSSMQDGDFSVFKAFKRLRLKTEERKALAGIRAETKLGGCYVCKSCADYNTATGADLSIYSRNTKFALAA